MASQRYLDRRLKLRMLRVADVVDTYGTILKASAALGLTQPALTKTIRELEDILQITIFERHSKGVRITEAGRLVVDSARRVLAELKRLDDEIDILSVPGGGSAAVGALPSAAAGILPGVLLRLKKTNPAIRVRIQQGRTEELIPRLISGDLDLVVGRLYQPAIPDELIREVLWSEPLSLVARYGHPIFAREQPAIGDLKQYELVLPTVTQRVGQEIEHMVALLKLTPTTSMRSNSFGFIREMLCESDVISLMPRLMMAGDLHRKTLRVIPLPVPAPERVAGFILRKGHVLPGAAQTFIDCLRDYTDQLRAEG